MMKRKSIVVLIVSLLVMVGVGYSLNEFSSARSVQLFGDIVPKVDTDDKVVALTFDDGPGVFTDEILAILNEKGVKATFYLTGLEIEQDFAAAERIVEEGHEVGNHSYSHPRMVFKSPSFIKNEIEQTDQLIRSIGYEGDIHFRPPYGKKFVFLPYYLSKNDRKTIMWNIEPESYPDVAKDTELIIEHVVKQIEPGSIILLHVMYESRIESLKAVEGIVTELEELGYTFQTVSELLKYEK
ncbi:hypothetical protein JCM9152_198 [Halalkalibacter hemicellulosilyticusJCM 9152]|uniref:NodB homology domain-containing protein n=2 Tax=Halalkalibacter TaxID=2893056 RepID=W4Q9Y0_9BACI|nr:hypothetical protein JCM9152_198 [Halalkalibacter hemicellulosilyticusJCM 9152]